MRCNDGNPAGKQTQELEFCSLLSIMSLSMMHPDGKSWKWLCSVASWDCNQLYSTSTYLSFEKNWGWIVIFFFYRGIL